MFIKEFPNKIKHCDVYVQLLFEVGETNFVQVQKWPACKHVFIEENHDSCCL